MSGPNEKAAAGAQAALDTADRQANPTEWPIDMQACRELFAELAADNARAANQLSGELRNIVDDGEKSSMHHRIFEAMRLATMFKAGAMRHLPRAEGC